MSAKERAQGPATIIERGPSITSFLPPEAQGRFYRTNLNLGTTIEDIRMGPAGLLLVEKPVAQRELIRRFSTKPSRRKEEVINKHRVRFRRPSRCNGVHDADTDPCGSPRCRTKGRSKNIQKKEGKGYRKPLTSELKAKK